MRTIFLAALLSATTALLSTQVLADPVKRVHSHGQDGDSFYYQVRCSNSTVASVVVQDKEKNICAQAYRGERVCKADWNVQRAAEYACR